MSSWTRRDQGGCHRGARKDMVAQDQGGPGGTIIGRPGGPGGIIGQGQERHFCVGPVGTRLENQEGHHCRTRKDQENLEGPLGTMSQDQEGCRHRGPGETSSEQEKTPGWPFSQARWNQKGHCHQVGAPEDTKTWGSGSTGGGNGCGRAARRDVLTRTLLHDGD